MLSYLFPSNNEEILDIIINYLKPSRKLRNQIQSCKLKWWKCQQFTMRDLIANFDEICTKLEIEKIIIISVCNCYLSYKYWNKGKISSVQTKKFYEHYDNPLSPCEQTLNKLIAYNGNHNVGLSFCKTLCVSKAKTYFPCVTPTNNCKQPLQVKWSFNPKIGSIEQVGEILLDHNANLEKLKEYYSKVVDMHSYCIIGREYTIDYELKNLELTVTITIKFKLTDRSHENYWQDF